MVFAFLFGLSMDYEVFILSRMREEYDRTGSTPSRRDQRHRPHRTSGHKRSADPLPRVPLARLGPRTDVKMLATALAAGILLDATVIRALIVPAVVSLMGRWNWWLPHWPARVLRVEPSTPRKVAGAAEAER